MFHTLECLIPCTSRCESIKEILPAWIDWSTYVLKVCLVPFWWCKGTFVIGKMDHVNTGQLTSVVKCVCGFWLAAIVVPLNFKLKILLQFGRNNRGNLRPQHKCLPGLSRALAQLLADGRTESPCQQQSQMLLPNCGQGSPCSCKLCGISTPLLAFMPYGLRQRMLFFGCVLWHEI